MSAKHTPGPWGVFGCGVYGPELNATHDGETCSEVGHCPSECGPAIFVAISPGIIADIKMGDWDDVEPPNPADLLLIAAAPELLQCLMNLVGLAERRGRLDEYKTAVSDSRTAIAKATGELPGRASY